MEASVASRTGADLTGIKRCCGVQAPVRAGVETFEEGKRPGTDRTIYWSIYREGATAAQGTDIWAVNNGYVSITPMRITEYDEKLAGRIRSWFK